MRKSGKTPKYEIDRKMHWTAEMIRQLADRTAGDLEAAGIAATQTRAFATEMAEFIQAALEQFDE